MAEPGCTALHPAALFHANRTLPIGRPLFHLCSRTHSIVATAKRFQARERAWDRGRKIGTAQEQRHIHSSGPCRTGRLGWGGADPRLRTAGSSRPGLRPFGGGLGADLLIVPHPRLSLAIRNSSRQSQFIVRHSQFVPQLPAVFLRRGTDQEQRQMGVRSTAREAVACVGTETLDTAARHHGQIGITLWQGGVPLSSRSGSPGGLWPQ